MEYDKSGAPTNLSRWDDLDNPPATPNDDPPPRWASVIVYACLVGLAAATAVSLSIWMLSLALRSWQAIGS